MRFITASLLLLLFSSCQKDFNPVVENSQLTLKSSDLVSVRASNINESLSRVDRKIEIIDRRNGSVAYAFSISLKCKNESDNLVESLRKGAFSGVLEVAMGNIIIERFTVAGGKILFRESHVNLHRNTRSLSAGSQLGYAEEVADGTGCAASAVHDCVAYKINDMNIIEYGLCLASAPGCYAGLWAGCGWDVCVEHKTYGKTPSRNI